MGFVYIRTKLKDQERQLINELDVIGREHPCFPSSLHGTVHPAVVDGLHVDDVVAVPEGDLVFVLGAVIVHGSVGPLRREKGGSHDGHKMVMATNANHSKPTHT